MTIYVCPGSDYWMALEHIDDLLNAAYDVKSKTAAVSCLRKIRNAVSNIIHDLNGLRAEDKDYFERVR